MNGTRLCKAGGREMQKVWAVAADRMGFYHSSRVRAVVVPGHDFLTPNRRMAEGGSSDGGACPFPWGFSCSRGPRVVTASCVGLVASLLEPVLF